MENLAEMGGLIPGSLFAECLLGNQYQPAVGTAYQSTDNDQHSVPNGAAPPPAYPTL